MKNGHKGVIAFLCIISVALCVLPIMRIYLPGGESGAIVVQGYNLMEFSAWGCVSWLAGLLIPVILFGCQSKAAKELELLLWFIGSMVCYVHSFNATRAWLVSIGGTPIVYHIGMVLYPFGLIVLFIVSVIVKWREDVYGYL